MFKIYGYIIFLLLIVCFTISGADNGEGPPVYERMPSAGQSLRPAL